MKPYTCRCCQGRNARHESVCSEHRLLLGMLALAAVAPLAACGGRGESRASVAPVDFTRSTACELDGMLLADYPGPKGQIHFAQADKPAFHCDTVEVLNALLQPEQVRKVSAVYVQDMGKTDWEHPQGAWIDARTALYVQGSRRHGSMGPTFASFSREADARAFIQQYGGKLLRMSDIRPEMVDLRGGANTDSHM
ncbi:nitrous oxide reductase accessory protein NosL [Brachymonas sp.]|uniref:nitrous oxide reductase accessory protein NosL n=1 Tax=unclassified Brachymonas TaxID=2621329 RepID=UPI0035AD7EF3